MEQPSEDAALATERSPSLAGSEEALILPERARGGSNSKAFKVAGLTTLACFLLASQVFTAYLVINQKGQIQDLKRTSESMQKDLTRSSHAAAVSQMRMQMPMKSLPLLTNFFDEDGKAGKIPLTKLEDTAIVSVEKQVKDLLESFQLPQFNETFLANLQSLKDQVEDSEWKGLETWMRYWLIFQMAQEKPAPPTAQPRSQWWTTAGKGLTKCQVQAAIVRPGYYQPQCDEQGHYKPMQCWHSTGYCWCVDENGNTIEGTLMRGRPVCAGGPRRMMALPRPMLQKALKVDDK